MEKIQFDNENFILYAPDSLKYITDNQEEILNNTLDRYKILFDIEEFDKVQINYFDDLEKFRQFIYKLRGEDFSLPSYAKGTFDNGMINAFIEKNIIINSPLYKKKLYMASHELFHIMYQKLIWKKENKERIVWFDEGMAQFFSSEFSDDLSDDKFEVFVTDVFNQTKVIPNLNELTHGDKFETEDYSGYKLSLLAVKYLYDRLSIEEFKALLHDNRKILKFGRNIVKDAFDYYCF